MSFSPVDSLATSGLVIVDKPSGITSHDVVAKLRRIFGTRKIGHAGTLDPMATGVLILGIERGTKFMAHMVHETKAYTATILLGQATTTDDMEGEVLSTATPDELAGVTDEVIAQAVADLTGDIMQRPASVSAIKIDGKRAHQKVRDGETFEIPPRPVRVMRFDVLEMRRNADSIELDVVVECSSGTYIRALARDLGQALQVGGHLIALRRTEVGPFSLADAKTLEQLAEQPSLLMSLDQALIRTHPVVEVTAEEAFALSQGKWLAPRKLKGVYAAVAPNGQAVALVKEQGKRLATVFVARPSTL